MSDTAVIRTVLVADATLTALVPANRIVVGEIQQAETLPAISIETISSSERKRVADLPGAVLMSARTQVTVLAASYADQRRILDAVANAIKGGRRRVAGVLVASIRRDIVGPDLRDGALGLYMQSRDFQVVYYRPQA
ncbi:DUF3168 domain-containing protein [Pseudoduganella sp. FT26W]|uniref:DUF3168 domain-containing protein n=1 Tax=Duganella aquatilis TaxID=2666082 RepID=A0A844DC77_9BURK|nr:DUF3168 domain-containing protein [Duganella aquatilis]MRW85410.1 DUF3168 domain-containing protein [Duganella aquatilis]